MFALVCECERSRLLECESKCVRARVRGFVRVTESAGEPACVLP